MATGRRAERIEWVLRRRQPDLTIVAEDIHDPHNVSAMLRSCEASGVMKVNFLCMEEKAPRIGKKSSASAGKWVERRLFTDPEECYSTLRREGFKIYATRLDGNAIPLYDLDLTQPCAFLFGNEHRGVTDVSARYADANVLIPMMGIVQSLNVSVACAVTLFEAMRQRRAAGMYDSARFSEEELRRLIEEWKRK